ncbi:MAG: hypothetical protein V1844_19305, partial [Pseudomonadota bacterium]
IIEGCVGAVHICSVGLTIESMGRETLTWRLLKSPKITLNDTVEKSPYRSRSLSNDLSAPALTLNSIQRQN